MSGRNTSSGESGGYERSVAVVEAVAEAENVDPTTLDPPLHTAIDADALDALFTTRDSHNTRVSFRYQGYHVTIDGEGTVTLEEASPDNATGPEQ